jgi:2-polyprenyl-3-methyl-5-hydroxy-6-metoxy-1,4-benzoquinol methylase
MRCWCGNTNLSPFSPDYARCDDCQTLVSRALAAGPVDTRVRNDAADFYGRDYWFGHQTDRLGCPDIVSRSRSDLADRCPHWLRSLLAFKLPPAKVLEVGCGHGGFVAMLRQAGYDATGLELSPAIVRFAGETFGVPVLTGPVEDQPTLTPGAFDAVVMLDVMEHLPDPAATLGRCLDLLKPDGVLLVQTPGYPEGRSLADLEAAGHKFPMMLDPAEHLYLFSRSAAARLLAGLGGSHVEFVPAVFGFYDMAFAVGRRPAAKPTEAEQVAALAATTGGRFLQALLDLDDRRLALLEKYRGLRDAARPDARVA